MGIEQLHEDSTLMNQWHESGGSKKIYTNEIRPAPRKEDQKQFLFPVRLCYLYRSAWKSYLKKLDPIHIEGLRLVLGAFRTSPVVSLYTEAHEAPLQLRCEKLTLQYYTKMKSCPSNPAYECIFNCKYKQ